MENELPKGWMNCKLGDICSKPQYGWTSKAAKQGSLKYLRTTDISDGQIDWEKVPYCLDEPKDFAKYQLHKGDILVSRAGSVGLSIRIKEEIKDEIVFASYLIRFQPINATVSRYVSYYLKSQKYWNQISEFTAGIAIPNVNASKLEVLIIPVAPLNQQLKIVNELDKIYKKIECSRARLKKARLTLQNIRQSVLNSAISGEQTEDWRKTHSELKGAGESVSNFRKTNSIKTILSDDIIFQDDIPESWIRLRLGNLFFVGNIFDGPFGSNLKTSDYVDHGVRVIRLENIGYLHFISDKESFISKAKYESLKKHTVGEGDILVSSFVTESVRAIILPKLPTKAIAKADCFCLRPIASLIRPQFLVYTLSSKYGFDPLVEHIHGATRPRINTTQLKNLEICLPSIDEQDEILRRINKLFQYADQIEARYNKAKEWFDKIPQAILAKAFRGELVPQDENDEPASELLKRIKQEKENKTEARIVKKVTTKRRKIKR